VMAMIKVFNGLKVAAAIIPATLCFQNNARENVYAPRGGRQKHVAVAGIIAVLSVSILPLLSQTRLLKLCDFLIGHLFLVVLSAF
jgi:hypothetical protein